MSNAKQAIEYFAPTHHEIVEFRITKKRLDMMLEGVEFYPYFANNKHEYRGIPFRIVEFEEQEGAEVTTGHRL